MTDKVAIDECSINLTPVRVVPVCHLGETFRMNSEVVVKDRRPVILQVHGVQGLEILITAENKLFTHKGVTGGQDLHLEDTEIAEKRMV